MNIEEFNAHFPEKLIVSPTINAKMWCLAKDFIYITTPELGKKQIIAQQSFFN